ncbi:transposase family protein [Rothia sp. (in: high G+C Gram-positive bacteria)]|uniref:transposase family protein n=1 Tax=Rothia sp. (in: high G+C Gram-positive bacteria) TaxID=1885016 RepID=UPI0034CE7AC3
MLLTLRHNLTQKLLAELFEISQSTVSRRCQRLHPTHRRGPPGSGFHRGRPPPDPAVEPPTDTVS